MFRYPGPFCPYEQSHDVKIPEGNFIDEIAGIYTD
jgi:hypothetical protein